MVNSINTNNMFFVSVFNTENKICIHQNTFLFLRELFQKNKSLCLEFLNENEECFFGNELTLLKEIQKCIDFFNSEENQNTHLYFSEEVSHEEYEEFFLKIARFKYFNLLNCFVFDYQIDPERFDEEKYTEEPYPIVFELLKVYKDSMNSRDRFEGVSNEEIFFNLLNQNGTNIFHILSYSELKDCLNKISEDLGFLNQDENQFVWVHLSETSGNYFFEKRNRQKMHEDLKDLEIYTFGDIHGELEGFKINLRQAGLIDGNDRWIGNRVRMIQMGDIIDRGPCSLEAYGFLRELQNNAKDAGGEVVCLLGNHELMVLQGGYQYLENSLQGENLIERIHLFRQQLIQDISMQKIQMAWTDGFRLYTHAGLSSQMEFKLREEISGEKSCDFHEITIEEMVDKMNKILRDYAREIQKGIQAFRESPYYYYQCFNEPCHYIFDVSFYSGGENLYGGVCWARDKELINQGETTSQVIAHNPPVIQHLYQRTDHPIRIINRNIINVDAGLSAYYGNNHAFIKIFNDQISFLEHQYDETLNDEQQYCEDRWDRREFAVDPSGEIVEQIAEIAARNFGRVA